MCDRIGDDVCEVVVDERVEHFSAGTAALDDACRFENSQVLADQRLGYRQCTHQFVHASSAGEQFEHDRYPDRS